MRNGVSIRYRIADRCVEAIGEVFGDHDRVAAEEIGERDIAWRIEEWRTGDRKIGRVYGAE